VHHREWLIARLLPHIQFLLTEQKVMTQVEVVEIVMHLEDTPRGIEKSVGLAQVQLQLANQMIQLQDMANTKVIHEHVWCTTCRYEDHHQDECPVLPNYVASVHFHLENQNGVRYVNSGSMCHPAIPP
jgi:Tfp pilus assembly protein PilN